MVVVRFLIASVEQREELAAWSALFQGWARKNVKAQNFWRRIIWIPQKIRKTLGQRPAAFWIRNSTNTIVNHLDSQRLSLTIHSVFPRPFHKSNIVEPVLRRLVPSSEKLTETSRRASKQEKGSGVPRLRLGPSTQKTRQCHGIRCQRRGYL